MKELQAVNQNLVLELEDENTETKTASGIIIPDTAKEKTNIAKVKWMSLIENSEIVPGDLVVYKPFSGTEIEFEGKKYLVLAYADVLAKVVEVEMI
ncbi:MAG: co-chaperone GroES [Bacteroidales bacterium]|jgi:chaperonin GroES|nr:co-chaperone GroES [Bacteroidales bacterium]MCK9499990.1 co-chaperone GroES [Bacteroidales bacterium]MDY0315368.1 co-chaperone GroES [Bacteroidales bacterium]NLM00482.1 co-chaperone GroES [Treponema sp.]